MEKKKSILENIIALLIIGAIVHIFLEDIGRLAGWGVSGRKAMVMIGFLLDLIFTLEFVIRSFTGQINSDNNISIRMGAIFWHFLGLLWLYLLLFLLFIH